MPKSSFDPSTQPNYFELFQRMVNPSGYSFQSLMFPILDEKEIEKKILECETVRHWLQANIGLLEVTIKTLEYQKTLLASGNANPAKSPIPNESMNPALWAWNMMNRAGEQIKSAQTELAKDKPVKRAPPKKRG